MHCQPAVARREPSRPLRPPSPTLVLGHPRPPSLQERAQLTGSGPIRRTLVASGWVPIPRLSRVDTDTILSLGRWSSHDIQPQRYIQEASWLQPCRPLGEPDHSTARPSIVHDGELDDLRAQLEGSAAKVASLNLPPKYTVSRKTHLPDPRAYGAGPADWCTKRGRPYGLARSRHSDRLSQPCRGYASQKHPRPQRLPLKRRSHRQTLG